MQNVMENAFTDFYDYSCAFVCVRYFDYGAKTVGGGKMRRWSENGGRWKIRFYCVGGLLCVVRKSMKSVFFGVVFSRKISWVSSLVLFGNFSPVFELATVNEILHDLIKKKLVCFVMTYEHWVPQGSFLTLFSFYFVQYFTMSRDRTQTHTKKQSCNFFADLSEVSRCSDFFAQLLLHWQ